MKLWLVSQNENGGYDTYDSFVVASVDAENAKAYYPGYDEYAFAKWNANGSKGAGWYFEDGRQYQEAGYRYSCWASSIGHVDVLYIGEAAIGIQEGRVLCSSFNAG